MNHVKLDVQVIVQNQLENVLNVKLVMVIQQPKIVLNVQKDIMDLEEHTVVLIVLLIVIHQVMVNHHVHHVHQHV